MADTGSELVSLGAIKSSPLESAGKFVKEKIIAPHTPEAHYRDIMKKYFWLTDKLEGKSLELTRHLRPTVEIAARAAGWSQTFTELYFAGQAAALLGFLGLRGLKSAASVFGDMAKRHGRKSASISIALLTAGTNAGAIENHSPKSDLLKDQVGGDGSATATDNTLSRLDKTLGNKKNKLQQPTRNVKGKSIDDHEERVMPKKQHLKAKNRREQDRRRSGIPVLVDDKSGKLGHKLKGASVPIIDENNRVRQDAVIRSIPSQEDIINRWGKAFDVAVGTDPAGLAQKEATLKLLNNMFMDKSDGGFFSELVRAMAEPNTEVRKQMVETTVSEAAEAFGVSEEVVAAVELLIEHQTNKSTAST